MNKLLNLPLLGLLLLFSTHLSARIYDIRELGADPSGKNKCTQLINNTIKQAAAEGGGTLYFPAGDYLTAAIHLQSNITLHLESGATLLFSDDFEDYLPFVRMRWEGVFMNSLSPLIYAHGAENITITGRGTINGRGHKWWKESLRIIQEIKDNNGKTTTLNELQRMWADANKEIVYESYYAGTIERKFFRPPLIQLLECKNIRIEGVTVENSPFWTINPEGCDNIVISGVTVFNPWANPKGHNTDGINPSSCRNVRISDCFISVGDDCITIKSGRDRDGRNYGRPCENLTITNCVMLTGHGGVVIGSEMSGSVKKVTISNCVFNGTNAGIRLKASRGRGGVVEEIRVDNIVMNDIQRDAFIFDLFYDKTSKEEPVTERTPVFRNIHLSNITGNNVNSIGYISGIEEMPVSNLSFTNINMRGKTGFRAATASGLVFDNVDFSVEKGSPFVFENCKDILLNNVRSSVLRPEEPVVEVKGVDHILVNNCFQMTPVDLFLRSMDSNVIWGNNFMDKVKTPMR